MESRFFRDVQEQTSAEPATDNGGFDQVRRRFQNGLGISLSLSIYSEIEIYYFSAYCYSYIN